MSDDLQRVYEEKKQNMQEEGKGSPLWSEKRDTGKWKQGQEDS